MQRNIIVCTYEWAFHKKGEPKNSGNAAVEKVQ